MNSILMQDRDWRKLLKGTGRYKNNSGNRPIPVGQKQPNQFGLHDVHGNVSEWCEDVYKSDFYSDDVPGLDPLSTAGSDTRVIRGGSWGATAQDCRSARRNRIDPPFPAILGFRPAVPIP